MLSIVFGALVMLTLITVFSAQIDLGPFNVPLALAIALTKAALVVGIFMALHWDNKVNAAVLAVGIMFVVVFISITLFDTAFRGDLSNTTEGTISEIQAEEEALKEREPNASEIRISR